MIGEVDGFDRPLVSLGVRAPENPVFHSVTAWIDTGCTGHLVLPKSLIELLGLPRIGRLRAKMADRREISVSTYLAEAEWLGVGTTVEVIQTSGDNALLGLCLLRGTELHISFADRRLEIERSLPKTPPSS